jgi:hypothetical protein
MFIQNFDLAETSLEISWNIREKVMQLGTQRISKGTKWPRLVIKATKGWKGVFTSQFKYLRYNVDIQQDIQIRGLGKFSWMLSGGLTDGDVPLFMMQTPAATGLKWNLAVVNSFETMTPSAFYHDKQAAFFLRMNFNAIKTKATWNEPQLGLHHAVGFGTLNNVSNHSFEVHSMDKGYSEAGIYLNGLFQNKFTAFGIGSFYRYGYYADADWRRNIVPKICLSVNM